MISSKSDIIEIELTWVTFNAVGVPLIGVYFPSGTKLPLDDPSINSIGGSRDLKSCDGLYCDESSSVVCGEKNGGWWDDATNILEVRAGCEV